MCVTILGSGLVQTKQTLGFCMCLKEQAQKYYDQHHPSVLKLRKVPPTGAHTV